MHSMSSPPMLVMLYGDIGIGSTQMLEEFLSPSYAACQLLASSADGISGSFSCSSGFVIWVGPREKTYYLGYYWFLACMRWLGQALKLRLCVNTPPRLVLSSPQDLWWSRLLVWRIRVFPNTTVWIHRSYQCHWSASIHRTLGSWIEFQTSLNRRPGHHLPQHESNLGGHSIEYH